ncbi:Predicted arabinose efflux permease, MFS family [Actinokineospora iranica]|uniref:Predicted arabinose efflux permease, MFS family n=1 Tax=Actinokineospora iranica TaxID=1271860 RepID=A0A1G6LUH4_9PSEU|nr:MFS transporter [Actinokineospora iranica]SDC46958.1 Predicted arabinose efflux permease, MFS family [Actinokineospora iranica]
MTTALCSHPGFRKLWAGDTIAQFGTAVGAIVLPLLAVAVLDVSSGEMGLLMAAESAAFLLIGLPAGAWVDRVRRRPLMIRMDLARAALLLSLPIAGWFGVLSLPQLVVVALLVGACTVFFDIGYQSYLPSLVGREHLMEGNAKLQASHSAARFAGPAIGGGLTQLVGAATALVSTGVGYLASALFLSRIRAEEPPPVRAEKPNLRAEVTEGLRFVFSERSLRAIVSCTATWNLFFGVQSAVFVLFLVRTVGLTEAVVGLVMALTSVGGILGAVLSARVIRLVGQARAIWLVPLAGSPFGILIPLARPGWPVGLLVLGLLVFSFASVVYNVAQVSFRQAICPDHLLGRMNANVRFIVFGTLPLGALAGGALGEWVGVRATCGCPWRAGSWLPSGWCSRPCAPCETPPLD